MILLWIVTGLSITGVVLNIYKKKVCFVTGKSCHKKYIVFVTKGRG